MTEFPRLLVATEFPPNGAGGGAAIVRQMLKDWPAEKLSWWSCYPDRDKLFGQNVSAHEVAAIPPKFYPNRRWRMQKSWLLEKFWVPRAARHLKTTLETLKPEVIWAIPHNWSILPLGRVLPETRIRFHVSVHDYPNIKATSAAFGAHRTAKMARVVDQLYARATTRDAICRAMADNLRAQTNSDGSVAHAALEQEDLDYLSGVAEAQSGPIRIAYAGTIISKETFISFVEALAQIRSSLPLTLDFFGDHSYRPENWFDSGWMRERGNLPARELVRALKQCTWGFAPMELTDNNPRYNRFSLPAKLASYLAAGLPIIALGHPESTVVKMASQYQTGLCLSDAHLDNLAARLLAAFSEPNPKIKYRPGIQRCAQEEFDARQMRAVLYEKFQRCASLSR
jgi:hypothetical protein